MALGMEFPVFKFSNQWVGWRKPSTAHAQDKNLIQADARCEIKFVDMTVW
jgi:hypothetical protein